MNIREALDRLGADEMAPEGSQAWTLAQVGAAVGELIEAADVLQRSYRLLDRDPDFFVRLRAALARVQGGQP